MKYCPSCSRKSVVWIKSIIQSKDDIALYYNYWKCNSCKRIYIEIINDEGDVISVLTTKEKVTVQTTFDDFG